MDFEKQLAALQADLKSYFGKAAEEKSQYGTMLTETKTAIENLQKQVDALDVKLAERHSAATEGKSLEETLREHDGVQRLIKDRSGRCTISLKGAEVKHLFERKTTVTSAAVGAMTTGVLAIDRTPGIVQEARQELRVRNLLASRPTTQQVVDFVRVKTAPSPASMQAEGNAIAENAVEFESVSEKIKTVATWIPATKQIMDDFTELAGFINSSLPYYVDLEEELQLLSGDGTGENLHGLITQAAAFNQALLAANDNKIDVLGRAIQQITTAKEIAPTFITVNWADWWDMRMLKDTQGRYILGDPQSPFLPSIWGCTVVPTVNIPADNWLVGSGNGTASEIRDRMEMQIEISTEHADFFARNLVAVRAEKRMTLTVKRPASYTHGTFSKS